MHDHFTIPPSCGPRIRNNMKPSFHATRGQALLGVVILFTGITTTVVVGITSPLTRHIQAANDTLSSAQSYLVAESLAEDLAYRLRAGMPTAASETLTVGTASASAIITSNLGAQTITSTGDVSQLERT